MDPQSIQLLIIGLILGLILGIGGGFATWQILARMGIRAARSQADELLAAAQGQAETVRKEADLQAKEETLRRREAMEREIEDARKGFREQEKRLEKRTDVLDQKLEHINKKEQDFVAVQRYLAEQQEEVNRKSLEYKGLLAEQRDVLHRVSGLIPKPPRPYSSPPWKKN